MDEKTNVMRILDKKKINYNKYCYVDTDAISGVEVAKVLKQDPNKVFKTLVTVGKSKNYYVFMIPVEKELDLKKAAKSVEEKSIEMIKSKDLLALTGYIHGGCAILLIQTKKITNQSPLFKVIFKGICFRIINNLFKYIHNTRSLFIYIHITIK